MKKSCIIFLVLVTTVVSCIVFVWTFPVEAQKQNYGAPMQPKMLTPQRREIKRLDPTLSLKQSVSLMTNGIRMSKELIATLNKDRAGGDIQNNVRTIVFNGMKKTASITAPKNEETLITQTILAIDQGNRESLHEIANKIQSNASLKTELRVEIAMLEEELLDWQDYSSTRELTYLRLEQQTDGSYKMIEKTEVMTKEEVESLLEIMLNHLGTISDMVQRDMLKLQYAQQKMAQVMQTLSNMMKMFHDSAKSIIQNLR